MAISVQQRTDLISIVVGMFNAAPGAKVLSDLTVAFEANQTRLQIATNLARSAEYLSIFPEFLTNSEFATKLVDNMVGSLVSATAKADAVTLLTAQLNAKNTSTPAAKAAARAEVTLFALDALKAVPTTDATLGAAVTALNNKVEVANFYSVEKQLNPSSLSTAQNVIKDVTNTAASVTTAKDTITGTSQAGTTYTLTTSPDNITGGSGNDTINGYLNPATPANSTLTAADVVNGGDGTDSLKLTVEGATAGSMPNATITSIEQFFIRDVATAASTYDFANITGETQVWADTATNAVTFSNLGSGAAVGLRGNNVLTNLGNVSFSMATASDAVTVAIDGGVKNTVAPTITATAGTATTATISSTGAANTVGAVTLSGGTNTITTLNINASSNLTAALIANDYAATAKMVVTGAGNVTLTGGAIFDGATIDGSASTGNLNFGDLNATTATVSTGAGNDTFNLQATAKVTVASGAGNDTVSLKSAIAAGSSINLGAGNDKLLFATGGSIATSTSTTIDGGDGTDTLSANLVNAGNAAQFKNFELLNLDSTTGLDLALLTGNTLTGLTMSSAITTNATYQNVAVTQGLTIDFVGDNSARTNTLTFKDVAGTSDAYTITFAGTQATAATSASVKAGTIVGAGIENVNIVSGGTNTWNELVLGTNANARTVTITGARNLDIDFVGFGTAGTNGVSSIDGSAATGRLDINTTNVNVATAGLTVKGGSANDTITLAQKATVDAGAGNDTITVSANGGTITTGAGTDTVDVKAAVLNTTDITTAVITTITDFTVGTDKLTFKNVGTEVFTSTKVDVSTATALLGGTTNALDLALSADGSANAQIKWFQYAGDTYVVQDLTAGNAATTDIVVKLTGLLDLSTLTVDSFNFA